MGLLSRPARLAASREARVWTLTAAVAAVTAALWFALVRHLPAMGGRVHVGWWLVALLFYLAEANVVHVYRHGDAHSFSLSEIPLVVGLVFLSPATLVLAQLAGATVALAVHRHQRPKKLGFNLAQLSLATTVALVVFHAVPVGHTISGTVWVMALAAGGASALTGILAVQAVIALSQGRFDRAGFGEVLTLGAIGTVANASLALLAATLLWDRPTSTWLLIVPVVVIVVAYRAYLAERERRRNLEFLYESTQILQRSSDVEAATVAILRHAREMFRAERAELVLFPGGDGSRALRAAVDEQGAAPLAPHELHPAELVQASLASDESGLLLGPRRRGRRRSGQEAAVALEGPTGPAGTLTVGRRLDELTAFGPADLRLLQTIANHVQASLDNGQLQHSLSELRTRQAELRQQALHDPLTSLANRTLFVQRLDGALSRSASTVGVLFIDLDDFKVINDTRGHPAGDHVLTTVASRVRSCLRPTDTAARLGGDEFAVLLDGTAGAAGATGVAERIQDVLRLPVLLPGGEVKVRASIGIAVADTGTTTAAELLARADTAMYRAKADRKESHPGYHGSRGGPVQAATAL